jgi:hypothetical protein
LTLKSDKEENYSIFLFFKLSFKAIQQQQQQRHQQKRQQQQVNIYYSALEVDFRSVTMPLALPSPGGCHYLILVTRRS